MNHRRGVVAVASTVASIAFGILLTTNLEPEVAKGVFLTGMLGAVAGVLLCGIYVIAADPEVTKHYD